MSLVNLKRGNGMNKYCIINLNQYNFLVTGLTKGIRKNDKKRTWRKTWEYFIGVFPFKALYAVAS